MDTQTIFESLWWIIPQKVGGVRKPTEIEIQVLQTNGVGAIVSVTDDPSNLDIYERIAIPYLWLPVKGGTIPTVDQINTLCKFIEKQNTLGHGVVIHCTNGRKRTGTFLAAYLINTGKSYDQSWEIIHLAKPDLELNNNQTDFLKELANS